MPGQDERRAVGEEEPAFDRDARRSDRVDLREQRVGVDDHARPDYRSRSTDDSRGKEVEREVLVAELDGVSGVVPAMVARHDLEAVGEQVDDLSLPLVAPLAPEDGCDFHAGKVSGES